MRLGESMLKRLAIQVVASLPDDLHDARAVLDRARQLVDEFLADEKPSPGSNVVSINKQPTIEA